MRKELTLYIMMLLSSVPTAWASGLCLELMVDDHAHALFPILARLCGAIQKVASLALAVYGYRREFILICKSSSEKHQINTPS